eukprot:CAMPEP_0178945488 /NCGR_PEP_ID=MMETSP0789-20121207/3765_1 /TAXON_ID=3005 /ORGANISM="Rhizosolenia setigera, Strain CCMP 1694" /LENGTH=262 /DNA_ID=CAMNT_0020625389 /DNA_START=118 /DNA_END=906 /DNA_ORIENTATION=+
MGTNQSKKTAGATTTTTRRETEKPYQPHHDDWPWVWGMRDAENLDWKKGLSQEEIVAHATYICEGLPVPITPNLYLGTAKSVWSISTLQEKGITAVLNMVDPRVLPPEIIETYQKHGIRYKNLHAEDEIDFDLLEQYWEEAYDFIQASASKGEKCVVHCVAGLNRSGLIAASYHMITTKSTVLESVRHLRRQRGNSALCNEGFQQQLVAMARTKGLLGPLPGTKGSIVTEVPPPAESDWTFSAMVKKQERKNPLDLLVASGL